MSHTSSALKAAPQEPMTKKRSIDVEEEAEGASAITSEEFVGTLQSIFGKYAWKSAFVRGTGYSRTQIYRYSSGHPIPLRVATFVEALAIIRAHGLPLPSAFCGDYEGAPWPQYFETEGGEGDDSEGDEHDSAAFIAEDHGIAIQPKVPGKELSAADVRAALSHTPTKGKGPEMVVVVVREGASADEIAEKVRQQIETLKK